jgi:hypothetical protein
MSSESGSHGGSLRRLRRLRRLGRRGVAFVFLCASTWLVFETGVAFFQPETEGSVVLRTFDATGDYEDRRLSLFEDDGELWLVSTHWFRSWMTRLHHNQNVRIDRGEGRGFEPFRAVPVDSPEARRRAEERMGRGSKGRSLLFWGMRAVQLFAPVRPVRLDPVELPKPIEPANPAGR